MKDAKEDGADEAADGTIAEGKAGRICGVQTGDKSDEEAQSAT